MRNTKYILLSLMLTSCVTAPTYPMGMSQAQWQTMTPAQQQNAIAQEQQQQILQQQQFEQLMRQQQQQQLATQKDHLELGARQRLGISDQEWASIPPEKRFELRQQQDAIERQSIVSAQPVIAGDPGVAIATQDIANAMREDSRRQLYSNAAYGSVVECDVSGGNGKFAAGAWKTKWAAIMPTRFSVAKGDARDVPITRMGRERVSSSFWVGYSENQQLEFCASAGVGRRYKSCRAIAVNDSFRTGISTGLSIPDRIDGATLACRFAPGRQ